MPSEIMATIPKFGGGFPTLLKDGYKFMKGTDEAIFRNIEATKQLSAITRTSLGPNGIFKTNFIILLFVPALEIYSNIILL